MLSEIGCGRLPKLGFGWADISFRWGCSTFCDAKITLCGQAGFRSFVPRGIMFEDFCKNYMSSRQDSQTDSKDLFGETLCRGPALWASLRSQIKFQTFGEELLCCKVHLNFPRQNTVSKRMHIHATGQQTML